jgi:predicted transcriptional regulator
VNAIAGANLKDEADRIVLEYLSEDEGTGIVDMIRCGLKQGTIRASLKRLVESGSAKRKWDGNERFGRYLYFAAKEEA